MFKKINVWVILLGMLFATTVAFAQEVAVDLGDDAVGMRSVLDSFGSVGEVAQEVKTAVTNFPNVAVPDVATQIKMYREAYASHNHEGFDAENTHVDGLGKMLEIGFSYADSHLTDPEYKAILRDFWQEVCADMETQRMTIKRFKAHNLRLANGLTRDLGIVNEYAKIVLGEEPGFAEMQTTDNWKQLDLYLALGDLKVFAWPFCFEAVLYHAKGVIDLMDFVNEYLREELVLGLSAMPIDGKGPHDDLVYDPLSFLYHDFGHWEGFVGDNEYEGVVMGGDNNSFKLIRRLLACVYGAGDEVTLKDQVAVFLLLHEITPSMRSVVNPLLFDKGVEALLGEEILPKSDRLFFRRLTIGAAVDDADKYLNRALPQEEDLKEIFYGIDWLSLYYDGTWDDGVYRSRSISQGEDGRWCFAVRLQNETPCMQGGSWKCHRASDPVVRVEADFEKVPYEIMRDVSTVRLINVKVDPLMDEVALREQCEKLGMDCMTVSFSAIQTALGNVSRNVFTQEFDLRILYIDIAHLLRLAMGVDLMPEEFTPEQIFAAQNQLFLEFYNKYKHLYSDAEITDEEGVKATQEAIPAPSI